VSAHYAIEQFDVVSMNHVIEHVPDPIALLQECKRVLKPGGRLVVATPNIQSYGHQVFKQFWYHLDPPRHLHLFTSQTLLNSVQRAGFVTCRAMTTQARSEASLWGSLVLSTRSRQLGTVAKTLRRLKLLQLQYQQTNLMKASPNLGEEIVLIAQKS
jgi:2-polyprenyl-3-methyl-5-hydroxy-6-metoxy-1,4-benzoquinol methylase